MNFIQTTTEYSTTELEMLLIELNDRLRTPDIGDLGRNKLTVLAVPPLDQKLETSVRVRSANDRLGLQASIKSVLTIAGIPPAEETPSPLLPPSRLPPPLSE